MGGSGKMANEKEPDYFRKVFEEIEKNKKEAEKKENFKQLREFYLGLIEAGFTMEEAMTFMAAIAKSSPGNEE
jgi:hypothetical protein